MAISKISEKIVRALDVPEKGNRVTYFSGAALQGQEAPRGFGVRTTANGKRAFVMNYRVNGLERRYTIGEHPAWSVVAAIKEAKKLRKAIDKGDDPLAERVEKRDAATVKQLCRRFLDEHVDLLRPSTQRDYRSLVAIIDQSLGSQKIETVTRPNIVKLHRARKATPYRANRLLAVASAMFNFGVHEAKLCSENPCERIKRFPEDGRERYLAPEELARLTDALADYPAACVAKVEARTGDDATKAREDARVAAQRACDVVRLALLTGARSGEILSAQWAQFDFNRGTWTKKSAHTKQAKTHVAHLSDAAVLLLQGIHETARKGDDGKPASAFVFPGKMSDQPLTTIKGHWQAIRTAAELPDFRLHDARHNYASLLANAGASLPIIGRLLGHTQAQTTLRYTHLMADPLKQAADAAGAVVTGKPGADVVQLKGGAS